MEIPSRLQPTFQKALLLWRPSHWGFIDQGLMSSANFTIMILLARALGPSQYGSYVLAYTVLLFLNTIQTAGISQPHNVLGAMKRGDDFAHYTTTLAILLAVFSALTSLLIGLSAWFLLSHNESFGWLLLATIPVSIAWQFQEFARRVLYTQQEYSGAFRNDLVAYGGQAILAVVLWRAGHLTEIAALGIIGVTSLAGAIFGFWQIRSQLLTGWSIRLARSELKESWSFTSWLLGSAITAWLSGRLYPVAVAGIVGVAALGGMRASENLAAPSRVLSMALSTTMLPAAARSFQEGGRYSLEQMLWRSSIPLLALAGTYSLLVAVFSKQIMFILMGNSFVDYAWLVWIYATISLIDIANSTLKIYLRSIGKTAPTFASQILSALFVLTAGIVLVKRFGIYGAAAGLIIHLCVSVSVQAWFVFRYRVSVRNAAI